MIEPTPPLQQQNRNQQAKARKTSVRSSNRLMNIVPQELSMENDRNTRSNTKMDYSVDQNVHAKFPSPQQSSITTTVIKKQSTVAKIKDTRQDSADKKLSLESTQQSRYLVTCCESFTFKFIFYTALIVLICIRTRMSLILLLKKRRLMFPKTSQSTPWKLKLMVNK